MGKDKVGRKYVTGVFPGKRENEKKRNPSRRVGAGGVLVVKKEESRRSGPFGAGKCYRNPARLRHKNTASRWARWRYRNTFSFLMH